MVESHSHWREAVHEAGHAVMAVLLGRPIVHVQIEPQPETKMRSPTVLPKRRVEDSAERAHLEGEAMLALAGLSAERVLGVASQESLVASRADLEIATRVARLTVGGARADKAVAHHISVVERMLERRRELVVNLAKTLLEKQRLSGDDVRAIVPRQ
ncbi:MAG: hypothetical protein AAF658_10275 [Myxococcota bacterium]